MSNAVSFSTRRLLPLPDAASVGMRFVALGGADSHQLWGIDCQGCRCLYDHDEWHLRDQTSYGLVQLSVNENGDGLAVARISADDTQDSLTKQTLYLWRAALNDRLLPVSVSAIHGTVVFAVPVSGTAADSNTGVCYCVMQTDTDGRIRHQVCRAVLTGLTRGAASLTEPKALGDTDIVQVAIATQAPAAPGYLYGLGADGKLYVYEEADNKWTVVADGPFGTIGSTVESSMPRIYTVSSASGQLVLHREGQPSPLATRRMFSVNGVVSPSTGSNISSIVTLDRSGNVFRDGPENMSRYIFQIESRGMLLAASDSNDNPQKLQWVAQDTAGAKTVWQIEVADHWTDAGPTTAAPHTRKDNAYRVVLVQDRSDPAVTGAVVGNAQSRTDVSLEFDTRYYNSPDPFTLILTDGSSIGETGDSGAEGLLIHEQSGLVLTGPESVVSERAVNASARAAGPAGTSLLTFRPVVTEQ